MNLEKLLNNKLCKGIALAGLSLLSFTNAQAQTNVTVDANAEFLTGVVAFHNDMSYWFYAGDFPLDALKTIKDPAENTLTLYPNYSTYTAGNPDWSNGLMGNTILYTLSYIQNDALIGQNFTFSGKVTSHTLVDSYKAFAFIKVLNANNEQITEIASELTEEGNFTLAYDATNLAAGNHVQYGFQVRGLNANPIYEAEYGNVVVTSDEPGEVEPPGSTDVTISATTPNLLPYVNWFQLDGTTYINGSTWDFPALKSVMNTDGSIDLHPNFSVWGNGANSEWVNNGVGQRVLEGNTYIDNGSLIGETVTFRGHCFSNTLADGYDGIAFIKVLDAGYQLVKYENVPLVGGEDFEITVGPGDYVNGAHFQYGYSVTGVNADPANEAALGFAKVGAVTAGVKQFDKKAISVYPNPATDVLNVSSQNDVISTIEVYNLIGQQVINVAPNATLATVNVSALKAGVYMVNATVNGKTSTSKFIKQ